MYSIDPTIFDRNRQVVHKPQLRELQNVLQDFPPVFTIWKRGSGYIYTTNDTIFL